MEATSKSNPRLGRPRKAEVEQRRKRVRCWLSPAERDHLTAAAGKATLIDFARDRVLAEDALASPQPAMRKVRGAKDKPLDISLTYGEHQYLLELVTRHQLPLSDYLRQALIARSAFDTGRNQLRLDVSARLANKLTAEAAEQGMSLAEFLAHRIQQETPAGTTRSSTASILTKLDQTKLALDRIGNNVNQIAKSINAGKNLPGITAATAIELEQERQRAAEVIEEVAKHYAS